MGGEGARLFVGFAVECLRVDSLKLTGRFL